MQTILKSVKLANVCYDIRGPVLARAKQMEEEGQRIVKLNIGNPAPFGFMAPEEMVQDIIRNLPDASGYCDSKGLFAARACLVTAWIVDGDRLAIGRDFVGTDLGDR